MLPLNRDEQGNFRPPLHWAAHGLRLGLFAAGCALGLVTYDALGSALSLLGGEPMYFRANAGAPHPSQCRVGLSRAYGPLMVCVCAGLGSISCSLVLPTLFYARLAWRDASAPARCGLAALLVLAAGLVVLVTGMNICELSERCSGRQAGGGGAGGG